MISILSRANLQNPEKLRADVQKIICLDMEKHFWNMFCNKKYKSTVLTSYIYTRYDPNKFISAKNCFEKMNLTLEKTLISRFDLSVFRLIFQDATHIIFFSYT